MERADLVAGLVRRLPANFEGLVDFREDMH